MGVLIERDEAIERARRLLRYYGTNDITPEFAEYVSKNVMEMAPVVGERKTGRWLRENMARDNETFPVIRCSECEWCYPRSLLFETKYCPVCGAKMEHSKDE